MNAKNAVSKLLALLFSCSGAFAGDEGMRESRQWTDAESSPFQKGRITAQVMAGYYVYTGLGPGVPFGSTLDPQFDYAPISLRLGYLINTPPETRSLLRGSAEILAELMTAPVTQGYADIVVGPSLLLRYNFVQPSASIVPYIQAGTGLVYSDAYETPGQDALGEAVEFLLQAQAGVKWILNDRWSLDFEGGYQHISNAGFADRNGGINNFGGSVGFTYYLPQWRK